MNGKLLGQNISYLRKKKNMTQQELANKIGITREQLSNYEGSIPKFGMLPELMALSNRIKHFQVSN